MKIRRWIRSGKILRPHMIDTTEQLFEDVGQCLDDACSWEIVGECVFEGEDGKVYAGSVEFSIYEADPAYVRDLEQENTEEASQ